MDASPSPSLSVAERYYLSMRKAQKEYYKRKNPNPKPRGRPRKVTEEVKVAQTKVICSMCTTEDGYAIYNHIGEYYAGDDSYIECPGCSPSYIEFK
jgi:hypothetical protein